MVGAGSLFVVLREALSSESTPLAKLINLSKHSRLNEIGPVFPQVNGVDPRHYQMSRQLSPTERSQIVELYHSGKAMNELARQFGIHRCTVAKHLQRAGIDTGTQLKMTPSVVERAMQPTPTATPSPRSADSWALMPAQSIRRSREPG